MSNFLLYFVIGMVPGLLAASAIGIRDAVFLSMSESD